MKFRTAYISNAGGREKNDDTVLIRHESSKACVFVGDGLGGYDGGRQASMSAAKAVMEYSRKQSLLSEDAMKEAVKLAEQAVRKMQALHRGQMKTTLVLLSAEGENARWAHVGDSRLYCFQKGKLLVQTMDHSVSQVAVLMGEISQNQIRFHEDRNRVLRALGSDNARPDVSPIQDISNGTYAFLLCTDGFWEYVYEKEMEDTLKAVDNPEAWLTAMEHLLLQRVPKEHDNYSAAAVFCEADV